MRLTRQVAPGVCGRVGILQPARVHLNAFGLGSDITATAGHGIVFFRYELDPLLDKLGRVIGAKVLVEVFEADRLGQRLRLEHDWLGVRRAETAYIVVEALRGHVRLWRRVRGWRLRRRVGRSVQAGIDDWRCLHWHMGRWWRGRRGHHVCLVVLHWGMCDRDRL